MKRSGTSATFLVVVLLAFWLLPVQSARAVAPTVSSIDPAQGPEGTAVTVTGTDFTGATDVTFNGISATFTVDSATQISTTVPTGATTGPIGVTTPDGTGTSIENFTVIVPPQITGFSPTHGHFRTLVTISGSGFSGVSWVRFNGHQATFNVVSDTTIRTRVPSGAGTGPIRVANAAGVDFSNTNFRFERIRHRVVITMQLDGHLRAVGRIRVPSSAPRIRRMCGAGRRVAIQRYSAGRFRTVKRGRTHRDRHYSIALADREGRYRSVVRAKTTPNHLCLPDHSRARTHEHATSGAGGGGGGGGTTDCTPGYSPCIPPGPDVDCYGGSGDGPRYTQPGVVYRVTGSDPYGLDSDNDGFGCEG